jgi:hypothetical protein
MRQRWVLGLVAVVAVAAAGGIGFAAFTSNAYIGITVASGTLGPLYWSNAATPVPTESFDNCGQYFTTFINSSDTWVISATNLAPGDGCVFAADLNNAGSIPAVVTATFYGNVMPFCSVSNTVGTPTRSGPIGTIAPGGYLPYSIDEYFFAGEGNAWNTGGPYSCSVSITFTATAGT